MAGKTLQIISICAFIALFYIAFEYADQVGTFSNCRNCLILFNHTVQTAAFQQMKDNLFKLILTFFITLLFSILLETEKKEKSIYLVQVLDHREDDDHSIDEAQEKPLPENDAAVIVQ